MGKKSDGATQKQRYAFRPPEPFLQRDLETLEAAILAAQKGLEKQHPDGAPESVSRRAVVQAAATLGWIPGVRDAEGVRGMPPQAVSCLALTVLAFRRALREPDPEACGGPPVPPTATGSPRGN